MSGSADLLQRQISVLRWCAAEGRQSFGVLRQRLGVAPSTLARLLRGLRAAGLLREASEGYVLAPGATRLAVELLGGQRPVGTAQDAVEALARQTGASAVYWTLESGRLILLAKCEVDGGFHYMDRFAYRAPASSVFGIAILAGVPAGLGRAGVAARRLARQVSEAGWCAGTVPAEPSYWRIAAPVRAEGVSPGAIGLSRHACPHATVAERDRRCVQAAALRLAQRLSA